MDGLLPLGDGDGLSCGRDGPLMAGDGFDPLKDDWVMGIFFPPTIIKFFSSLSDVSKDPWIDKTLKKKNFLFIKPLYH